MSTQLSKIPAPVRDTIAHTLAVLRSATNDHLDCIAAGAPCADAKAIFHACEVSISTFLVCCETMGVDGEAVIAELKAGTAS